MDSALSPLVFLTGLLVCGICMYIFMWQQDRPLRKYQKELEQQLRRQELIDHSAHKLLRYLDLIPQNFENPDVRDLYVNSSSIPSWCQDDEGRTILNIRTNQGLLQISRSERLGSSQHHEVITLQSGDLDAIRLKLRNKELESLDDFSLEDFVRRGHEFTPSYITRLCTLSKFWTEEATLTLSALHRGSRQEQT